MSLRVWLPLNGTLDNQGLDDIVVTNNGATIDNSGKIGKCYSFDGSNDYISFPYSFSTTDWSYSIWFYTTSTNTQTLGCCRNGVGFGFSIFLISNKVRIDGIIGNNNQQWTTTYTFPTNTWINLIVTSKNGLIKYYINGEYQTSKNITVNNTKLGDVFTIGASQTNGNNLGNYFKGKINDVRIYDHALSLLEVKQISQGLILHYPLNNININENVQYDCSGYCHNGERIGTFEYTNDTPKYDMATHINNVNQKIYIQGLTTAGFGDSYSFAWWGKRNSNSPMFWGFSNGIRLNGMYTGRLWNTSDASNNPLYEIDTTIQVTAPTVNIWHHYVMTGNGEKNYVYLDGELWAESKIYKSINGTAIYINGFDNQTHYSSNNMSISDFRIYATALSAEDILALYKNSVYIDNEGNLYGAELREV